MTPVAARRFNTRCVRALTWMDGTERWPSLTRWQWLDMRVWLDGCVLRKVDAQLGALRAAPSPVGVGTP